MSGGVVVHKGRKNAQKMMEIHRDAVVFQPDHHVEGIVDAVSQKRVAHDVAQVGLAAKKIRPDFGGRVDGIKGSDCNHDGMDGR